MGHQEVQQLKQQYMQLEEKVRYLAKEVNPQLIFDELAASVSRGKITV